VSDTIITKDGAVSSSSQKLISLSHSNRVILYNNSITTNNFDFATADQAAQSNFYGDVEGAIVAENADSFIEADWYKLLFSSFLIRKASYLAYL
jgi:hypothetical protein